MKTDVIEIFQTIRASLQPYATLGFTNHTNSDELYDLWSDKNLKVGTEDRTETFFTAVKIENDEVSFCYHSADHDVQVEDNIKNLDDLLMKKIEDDLSVTYKVFKEREWI